MIKKTFTFILLILYSGYLHAQTTAISEKLTLSGPLKQGGMIIGKTRPEAKVWLDERSLAVDQGVFVFGLDRDAPEHVNLKLSIAGEEEIVPLKIAARQYDIQRIEGIAKKYVSPGEAALKRIREDAQLVKKTRERDLPLQYFNETFVWPAQGRISGVYGSQRIFNGQPRQPHYGVDVALPVGSVVVAPASGVVTLAHPDLYFSGATLIIDHGRGISSTFLHLNRILVKEGHTVKQGEPIAESGSSGRATGPHLDWRMNWFEHRIDPQLLVGTMLTAH